MCVAPEQAAAPPSSQRPSPWRLSSPIRPLPPATMMGLGSAAAGSVSARAMSVGPRFMFILLRAPEGWPSGARVRRGGSGCGSPALLSGTCRIFADEGEESDAADGAPHPRPHPPATP